MDIRIHRSDLVIYRLVEILVVSESFVVHADAAGRFVLTEAAGTARASERLDFWEYMGK